MIVLRRANLRIYMWWNSDKESRHGLCQHNYIANGCFVQSNQIGALVIDVIRPTEYTDIFELMKARGKVK